jgi:hypothetical protein
MSNDREATIRRTRTEHRFFFVAGTAAFAIVFVGFARTYYLKTLFSTPALSGLLHLHGFLMTSWFALFFVQVRLVATRRVELHRRLGVVGGALATLIVITGITVARQGAARDIRTPNLGGPPPLQGMGFVLYVLLVFAILVGGALLLRRRRDYHKRLMLLSCLNMVGPGLSRLPLQHVPVVAFLRTGGLFGLFGLDLLLLYACIGYDTWRNHRLHPAFVWGSPLIMLEKLPFIWMFLSSATWTHFATRLVS